MLQTRLWMGAVLIALVAGVLVVDQWLAPWFPILFVLVVALACVSTFELLHLLKPPARQWTAALVRYLRRKSKSA